ncbi:hypothetical protein ACVW0J_008049 [Bradyrhizobium sp. i1.7.7]
MRLVDQRAPIHGAVEHDLLLPGRRQRPVVAEYALPGGPRQRRLDHGIGEIAKLALRVGELELGRLQADAAGGLGPEPAMHVVAAHVSAGAAEIAAAARAERRTDECEQDGRYDRPDLADGIRHCKSRMLAATTTAPRRCALLRPAIAAGFFRLALDADHGEDQNRSRFRTRRGIPRRACPATGRKFDNGPHISSLSIAARPSALVQRAFIKISSWLTGCKRAFRTVTSRATSRVPLRDDNT